MDVDTDFHLGYARRAGLDNDKALIGYYWTNSPLYYYDGTEWSEEQPWGDVERRWVDMAIDGDKRVVTGLGGTYPDRYGLFYDDGGGWERQTPPDYSAASDPIYFVDMDGGNIFASNAYAKQWYFDGSTWSKLTLTDMPAYFNGPVGLGLSGDKMVICDEYEYVGYYDGTDWNWFSMSSYCDSLFDCDIYGDTVVVTGYDTDRSIGKILIYDGTEWTVHTPVSSPGGSWFTRCSIYNGVILVGSDNENGEGLLIYSDGDFSTWRNTAPAGASDGDWDFVELSNGTAFVHRAYSYDMHYYFGTYSTDLQQIMWF